MAILPHGPIPPKMGLGGQSQPSDCQKTTQQGKQGQEGDIPTLGEGIESR